MFVRIVRRVATTIALVAVAVWLGGLLALGAIAAPVVFTMVSLPSSADAMTLVFQRFDRVAMSCAALVLLAEAAKALGRMPLRGIDRLRVLLSALAGAAAVLEGVHISPRIAALHAEGAVRGVGSAGMDLARLHDLAEWDGKLQVILLVAVLALQVWGEDAHRAAPGAVGLPAR